MSSPAPSQPAVSAGHHSTRRLDAVAAGVVIILCMSWGFNQVSTKLAMQDIPPLLQATIRSTIGALIVGAWCWWRGIKLFEHDGTLRAGLTLGAFFGIEFILIYQGLVYTTATRAILFLYLAPFLVVVGARILLPIDRFSLWQWLGLSLSFTGMLVAFGLPTPAMDPRQALGDIILVGAAVFWAASTLITKVTALVHARAEKLMLYQLVVSVPMMALAVLIAGERIDHAPSAVAIGALAYQSFWIVSVTFVVWYALVVKYSASRLSAFTFLTPLFGVAAGHLVLGEPLTPAFAAAVALVAGGLVLVNRTK